MTEWKPIDTAPKDGTHFLAWGEVIADEYDEYNTLIAAGVKEGRIYVAYGCSPFDGFATFPWRGSIPRNLTFTHWAPLPEPPK